MKLITKPMDPQLQCAECKRPADTAVELGEPVMRICRACLLRALSKWG